MTTEAKKHSVLKEYEPKQEQAIKNSKSKFVQKFILAGVAVAMLSGCTGIKQQPNPSYYNGQQQYQQEPAEIKVIPADEIFATRADTGNSVKMGIYQDSSYATAQQVSSVATMTALLTDQAIGIDSFAKGRETAYNRLISGASTGNNILDVAGALNRFFGNSDVDTIINKGRGLIRDSVSVGYNANKLFGITDKTAAELLDSYADAHDSTNQRNSHNLQMISPYNVNGYWQDIHANANNATINTFSSLCHAKRNFLENVARFVRSQNTAEAQDYLARAMVFNNQIVDKTTQLTIDDLIRRGAQDHINGNAEAGNAKVAQAQALSDKRGKHKTQTGNDAIYKQTNLFNTGNAYE